MGDKDEVSVSDEVVNVFGKLIIVLYLCMILTGVYAMFVIVPKETSTATSSLQNAVDNIVEMQENR